MSTLNLAMSPQCPILAKPPSMAVDMRSSPKGFTDVINSSGFLKQQSTAGKTKPHHLCQATAVKSNKWLAYEKAEEVSSMASHLGEDILKFLRPVEESWQPRHFLPDPTSDGFYDQVKELREETKELPDEYLVAIVGSLITEEALPTYECLVNNAEGARDITMCDSSPLSRWTRGWTAEENRHGDLLNKFLYLSGRVDMKQVEKTIHYLIRAGADTGSANDGFAGIMYTSFQERATFISQCNTAKLAKKYGNSKLSKICGVIAGDEKRHENSYTTMMSRLFEIDPNYSMIVFADMMRMRIAMPGEFMYDGRDKNLFNHFALVSHKIGIYSPRDYADVLEHLVGKWKIETLVGLSSEAQEGQEFLCKLAPNIRRFGERTQSKAKDKFTLHPFTWIFDRKVQLY